jgi:hypothetical protein
MRVPQVSERIKEAPAQALRGVFAGIGQLLLITDKLRNKAPAGRDVPRARKPETAGTVTDTIVTSPAGQREETPPVAAAGPAPAAKPAAAQRAPAKPATAKPATKPAAARRAPAKPVTAKPGTKPTAARRPAAKADPADPAAERAPAPPKPQRGRDFDKTGNVRLLGGQAEGSALTAAAPVSPAEPAPEAAAPEPVTVAEAATVAEPETRPADSAPPLPNYDELSVASLRARLRNLDVAQVRQLADYERAHAARADVLAMFERRVAKLEAEG